MSSTHGSSDSNRSLRDRFVQAFLMPRPWHGMTLPVWLRLLARNRFAVSFQKVPMAAGITGSCALNSVLSMQDQLRYGRRARRTQLDQPPLFLLGHWRSGTTLLHELFSEDEQFTYPTVYQTMAPSHFLSTNRLVPPLLDFLMPSKRPMDEVSLGMDRPMEDEFALCNLGSPSPYLAWAWPNRFECGAYMELEELSGRELERWKKHFVFFLKRLQISRPGRILLKSPPHTARICHLVELFPNAQFVHIVRDPLNVFPSSMKTWKRMQALSALHQPTYEGLEEQVLTTFTRMYERYHQDRQLVASENICEVRYEDLVENPVGEMGRMYEHLQLGDFQQVKGKVQQYMDDRRGYQTDKYELPSEVKERIARRWGPYVQRYGYALGKQAASEQELTIQ